MLGFVALLIVATWGFAVHGAYTALTVVVVSLFLLLSVTLPLLLWRIARLHDGADPQERSTGGVMRWLSGDFETWQYQLSGRDAAITILLPIVAVAVGMTAFAIEFAIVAA